MNPSLSDPPVVHWGSATSPQTRADNPPPAPKIDPYGIQQVPLSEIQRGLIESGRAQGGIPPDPATVPTVGRLSILDRALVRTLDPIAMHDDLVVAVGLSQEVTVKIGEVDAYALSPTLPGTSPTAHLSRDLYEPLVNQHGTEDTGETSTAAIERGLSAMRDVLRTAPPNTGLARAEYRGCYEVALEQAEAVGRHHGLSADRIAGVVGRPYSPRRSLLVAGAKARDVEAELVRQKAAEEAEEAKRRAERAAASHVNTRSLQELNAEGLFISNDELTQCPRLLSARLSFPVDGGAVVAWAKLRGLELPPGSELVGCKVAPSNLVPALRSASELGMFTQPVDNDVFRFLHVARAKLLPNLNRGPVESFCDDGIDAAIAFVQPFIHELYQTRFGRGFVPRYVAECLTRGFAISPRDAIRRVLAPALLEHHALVTGQSAPKRPARAKGIGKTAPNPVHSISPTSPNVKRLDVDGVLDDLIVDPAWQPNAIPLAELAQLCLDAATGGEIEPNSLLRKEEKHVTKKEKVHQ